jgi:hypothetical protein
MEYGGPTPLLAFAVRASGVDLTEKLTKRRRAAALQRLALVNQVRRNEKETTTLAAWVQASPLRAGGRS